MLWTEQEIVKWPQPVPALEKGRSAFGRLRLLVLQAPVVLKVSRVRCPSIPNHAASSPIFRVDTRCLATADGRNVFFDNSVCFEYFRPMSRISIEVTPQQHRRLKAVAALSGQSIKDYILSQSIPGENIESENPLQPLESFLEQRISQAASGGISGRSVSEIWADVQSTKA